MAKTSEYTSYFFIERFTKPVSPMGWSLVGPSIEKIALKEPLRYLGLYGVSTGDLIQIVNGYPLVKKEVFRSLFQIVPRKLVTEDKLNSFVDKKELKDFNFSFVIRHFPVLLFSALKDWNWFPPYHFLKWKSFKKENSRFYEEHKLINLNEKSEKSLLKELKKLIKRTKKFLRLHRWSFVYSEVFYGFLKGLIRRWVKTQKLDESIEIAEKLCSGFDENITARIDLELQDIARKISEQKATLSDLTYDEKLSDFIKEYSYRSESLDIFYPTWGEDASFVRSILKRDIEQIEQGHPNIKSKRKEQRLETTKYCTNHIKKNSFFLFTPFKLVMFKMILGISQRFMILREVQRNEWHKILSEKRRVIIKIARRLKDQNLISDTNDIFFLKYDELKEHIIKSEKIDAEVIVDRREERQRNLLRKTDISKSYQKLSFKGMGVSSGVATGKAVIINSYEELKKVKPGEILITKIIDSSWTPIFNIISGLVTENGGMLSHGSVVARELKVPAITNIKNITKEIKEGRKIKIDGTKGEVTCI